MSRFFPNQKSPAACNPNSGRARVIVALKQAGAEQSIRRCMNRVARHAQQRWKYLVRARPDSPTVWSARGTKRTPPAPARGRTLGQIAGRLPACRRFVCPRERPGSPAGIHQLQESKYSRPIRSPTATMTTHYCCMCIGSWTQTARENAHAAAQPCMSIAGQHGRLSCDCPRGCVLSVSRACSQLNLLNHIASFCHSGQLTLPWNTAYHPKTES